MADAETLVASELSQGLNVSERLTSFAATIPTATAVACAWCRSLRKFPSLRGNSGSIYVTISFAELERFASEIAAGLSEWGIPVGTRLALLVHPGIEFVGLVFGLLRAG